MNSFMSSIKSAAESAITGSGTDDSKKTTNPEEPSSTELLSSAKLVAEAAQCAASNQTDKIDKPKVAGAAADLLDAAKTYGKFDETQGVGQYLKQADDYLHQYEKSGAGSAPPKEEGAPVAPPPKEEGAPEAPPPVEEKKEEKKEEGGSGFGAADAMKVAGSFFK